MRLRFCTTVFKYPFDHLGPFIIVCNIICGEFDGLRFCYRTLFTAFHAAEPTRRNYRQETTASTPMKINCYFHYFPL